MNTESPDIWLQRIYSDQLKCLCHWLGENCGDSGVPQRYMDTHMVVTAMHDSTIDVVVTDILKFSRVSLYTMQLQEHYVKC